MKHKLIFFIIFLFFSILIYFNFFNASLPKEYKLWTDDKYWHTALLKKNDIVISPTVVDYYVFEKYILVLSVNRESHYSKLECESCLSYSSPCAKYWVINWETAKKNGPMNKIDFLIFIKDKNIPYSKFEYSISNFSGSICDIKANKAYHN